MSRSRVRAAALIAVTAISVGAAPAPASLINAPSALRQVADPAAAQLAAEKGLSIAEAQRRIDVQQRAPKLDLALAENLGSAHYGGVWIGHDDRIKVGIVDPDPAVLTVVAAHQLTGETDLVAVRHSLASLLAANNWLVDQLSRANVNATSAMVTGYTTAGNAVELGLPLDAAGMSPGQLAVLAEARQRYGSLLRTYTHTGSADPDAACVKTANTVLICDSPPRGGVWIANDADNARCTLGFLARGRSDNHLYGITAGHCLQERPAGTTWFTHDSNGNHIGLGAQGAFRYPEGGDAGIIQLNDQLAQRIAACACSWVVVLTSPETSTNERYPILRDAISVEGIRVCHTGAVSGTSCGRVQRLDQTSETGVRGLVEANYCGAVHGDSGGPVYSGNTAYGLHQSSPTSCSSLYQPIRAAEDLMNVDVRFDRSAPPGTQFRHNKNELSPLKYHFSRADGQQCHYRIRYGDFGTVAYAQIRFYAGPCGGSGVEVYGDNFTAGPWKKSREAVGAEPDACGRYIEFQATSPSGHSAAGMAVVTPDGTRIFYSHTYTDLPSNGDGPTCP